MRTGHLLEIPDHWKHPAGPYHQAPAEYGGEWWLLNPFTGPHPWKALRPEREAEKLPDGFVGIFGSRPTLSEFLHTRNPSQSLRAATVGWEQNLKQFKRAGLPEWGSPEQASLAEQTFQYWEMGSPRYYEGRYGYMARFPDSQFKDFETTAWAALYATHHEISIYQIRLLQQGIVPRQRHPFVPPHIWPRESDSIKEVL